MKLLPLFLLSLIKNHEFWRWYSVALNLMLAYCRKKFSTVPMRLSKSYQLVSLPSTNLLLSLPILYVLYSPQLNSTAQIWTEAMWNWRKVPILDKCADSTSLNIHDDSFYGLSEHLQQLYITHCNLDHVPRIAIQNLTNLRTLSLAYNKLTSLMRTDFQTLKHVSLINKFLA